MSEKPNSAVAVIGIDISKNSFHVVGLDDRGAIVLRQKWSRGQVEARFANMPPCLIGMEACVGAHHLSRKLSTLGHDARLMPAKYVRPCSKGQKNDFRDATHDRTIQLGHTLRSNGRPLLPAKQTSSEQVAVSFWAKSSHHDRTSHRFGRIGVVVSNVVRCRHRQIDQRA